MSRQRQLSLLLCGIGCFIPLLLLFLAPWRFSFTDFVIWPSCTLALPLIITGLLSWLRSDQPDLLALLLGLLIVFGIVVAGFASLWPEPNHSTTWEASYEQLMVFDILILPVWVGTIITALWKRSMRKYVQPANRLQR